VQGTLKCFTLYWLVFPVHGKKQSIGFLNNPTTATLLRHFGNWMPDFGKGSILGFKYRARFSFRAFPVGKYQSYYTELT